MNTVLWEQLESLMETPSHLVTGSYLPFPGAWWSPTAGGTGDAGEAQDTNDPVKAGQGPFQPVSSPHTSCGVGPGKEGCRTWCVPGKAAWQPPAMAAPPVLLPPCNLGSDSLLLRRDSARGLNLWTSCPHPHSQRSQASCHLKIWAWTSRSLSPFPYRTGGQKQLSMQKYAGNVPGKVSAASQSMGWGL